MARGYPDFFGYSVFPYSGINTFQPVLVGHIDAPGAEDIFSINVKGIVRGGFFSLQDAESPQIITIDATVDGVAIGGWRLDLMRGFNIQEPDLSLTYFSVYNPDLSFYALGITPEVSFGQDYSVRVQNLGAVEVIVQGALFYTWII